MQREKKRLLHEVRSKAHRRMNKVVLVCFLIMAAYTRVGETRFGVEVARVVPMLWKYLTFFAMFGTIWYAFWRIERRTFDRSLRRLETPWIVWLFVVGFGFAVVSADDRTLFWVGTFGCITFVWIAERYYKRKGERWKAHETPVA